MYVCMDGMDVCMYVRMGHRYLAKPKIIATGGVGGPGGPGQCFGEGMGAKRPNNFVLFFHIKHAKTVVTWVNIR